MGLFDKFRKAAPVAEPTVAAEDEVWAAFLKNEEVTAKIESTFVELTMGNGHTMAEALDLLEDARPGLFHGEGYFFQP